MGQRKDGEKQKTMSNKIEISEADVTLAVDLVQKGFKSKEVCEYLGYCKTTWYDRLAEHPEIVARLERAKQSFHLELAGKAKELAMGGDRDMLKFLLTRRFNYAERQEIEIKINDPDSDKSREELIEEIVKLAIRNKTKLPFNVGESELVH